jgi:hypothetical protein
VKKVISSVIQEENQEAYDDMGQSKKSLRIKRMKDIGKETERRLLKISSQNLSHEDEEEHERKKE